MSGRNWHRMSFTKTQEAFMDNKTPLITIGITCFNAEDLIINAIDHALEQDWSNKEILIVDDGSQDNSVDLIKNHIAILPNVRLIVHEQNKGFPSALNTIIQNASGEYIALLDDDDISRSDRLTKQYERLSKFISEKETHLVMCYTDRVVKYAEQDEIAYSFSAIGGKRGYEPHGEAVADYILWDSGQLGFDWGMFGSCTLMVHKKLFEEVGLFDPQFKRNTEWDMGVRCALAGGYFIAVNEPLITMTKTPTQDKAGKKPLQFSLLLREKHKEFLDRKGLYQASRLVATSRFYGGKAKKRLALSYMLLAMIIAPRKIGVNKIKRFINRRKAISI